MKKTLAVVGIGALLLFSGCSSSSENLSTSTIGSTKEVNRFINARVVKTEKVLVSKTMNAVLKGATAGAVVGGVGGAVAKKNAVTSGAIGAVIGGAIGALAFNNEEESFRTTLRDEDNTEYIAYITKQLQLNTKVEFVARDNGKVTNVNVLTDVNDDTLVDAISKRYFKNGLWHYELYRYGVTVISKKKYYYLNDLVEVTFDKDYKIVKINKLQTSVL